MASKYEKKKKELAQKGVNRPANKMFYVTPHVKEEHAFHKQLSESLKRGRL